MAEVDRLEQHLSSMDMSVALSHNDLHAWNILYDDDTGYSYLQLKHALYTLSGSFIKCSVSPPGEETYVSHH